MPELAAHDLTVTRFCKIAGCEQEAVRSGPPYGSVCEEHLPAVKAERDGRLVEGKRASVAAGGAANGTTDSSSTAGQLRAAAKIGRRVDRAQQRLAKLGEPEQLKAELAEAVRRVGGAPNDANLSRLEAATKALRRGAGARETARKDLLTARRELEYALAPILQAVRGVE